MLSVTDSLTERGIGWAALSGLEVSESIRVCHACADTPGRACQALAAYFFIVSRRSNVTMTAKATDAVVASVIPKTRGSGFLGADAYRKQIKPLLVGWGLVACSSDTPTGNGRQPTTYGFPMLVRLLEGIEPIGQDERDYSGYCPVPDPGEPPMFPD